MVPWWSCNCRTKSSERERETGEEICVVKKNAWKGNRMREQERIEQKNMNA